MAGEKFLHVLPTCVSGIFHARAGETKAEANSASILPPEIEAFETKAVV
jgi:hypothetical protein